jgi:hypothetical protein
MEHPLFCYLCAASPASCCVFLHKTGWKFGHTKVYSTLANQDQNGLSKNAHTWHSEIPDKLNAKKSTKLFFSHEAKARSRGGQFCSDLGKAKD